MASPSAIDNNTIDPLMMDIFLSEIAYIYCWRPFWAHTPQGSKTVTL